jgi:hypothetical protein
MIHPTLPVKTILALVAVASGLAQAQQPAGPEPAGFLVSLAEGEPRQGALRLLNKDWSVQVGGEDAPVVPGDKLVSLRRVGLPLPPWPDEMHLVLVNGDCIPIDKPRLEGERLHFVHPDLGDGKEVTVPLGAVAMLWLEAPVNADDAEKLRRRLLAGPRKRDRVLLSNGDAVEGNLEGLDVRKITIGSGKKASPIDLKQVSALVLSSDLAENIRPKGVHAQVVLIGDRRSRGSRITLASATSDGKTLQGITAFGVPLRAPLEQVAALDILGGRAVYLSELKPTKYEFAPYLDIRWPLAVNASVAGRDLRIGPGVHTRGLGMHPQSRATFTLDGKYRRFEAVVGLDPKPDRTGSARIRVLADGKPLDLGGNGELTARQPSRTIQVGIEGVKELTLETDFGTQGVQADVNWADARVVR